MSEEPQQAADQRLQRYRFVRMCAIMGLQVVVYSMFKPLVPLFAQDQGASPATIGLIVAIAFLPSMGLAIPIGAFVDRWGATLFLRSGSVLFLLGPVLLTQWPTMSSLVIVQVILGTAHLMVVVGAQSLVAGFGAGLSREAAFGWFTTALAAGEIAGPLIAGVAIDSGGFQFSFLIASTLAVAPLASMMFLKLPMAVSRYFDDTAYETPGTRMARMFANNEVRVAIAVSSTVLIAIVTLQTFLPVYLALRAFPATAIGTLMSTQSLAALSVRPLIGRLVKFFPSTTFALVTLLVLISVGLGAITFAPTLTLMAIAVALVGVGFGVSQPLSMALVIDNVGKQERGFALGLRISGNRVVQTSAPLLMGLIGQIVSVRSLFAVAAWIIVFATIQIARWARSSKY